MTSDERYARAVEYPAPRLVPTLIRAAALVAILLIAAVALGYFQ